MSPNSNIGINEIISWKGRTFNQISSSILKNGAIDENLIVGNNIFKKRGGRPLKIYRREIVVPSDLTCNERKSMSIEILNMPGGSITNSSINDGKSGGLVNTQHLNVKLHSVHIDIGSSLTNTKQVTIPYYNIQVSSVPTNAQDPSWTDAFSVSVKDNVLTVTRTDSNAGWAQLLTLEGWVEDMCSQSANCPSESVGTTQSNALRRLRSGGMIKKQFDLSNDKATYYTNTQQYINSRNRGFNQNQYYYIRTGNSSATPGDSLSTNNIYASNTLTNCKKFYLSAPTSFQYTWVNQPTIVVDPETSVETNTTPPATVTVTVPVGYYDTEDLNNLLHNTMIANRHYYQRENNQTKVFLINIVFNNTTENIELTVSPISAALVLSNNYKKAFITTQLNVSETTEWTTPTVSTTPQVTILDNEFKTVIGFASATYPSANTNTTDETFVSAVSPLIKPRYNRVYYKPNNPQFAQQGAVTSSSKIARIKYDTITNTAASYTSAYGLHVANALAYNVPANGYTIKDKLGYPNKNTPTVTTTGEMRFCR